MPSAKPEQDDAARAPLSRLPPGQQRHREHAERERSKGQAGLHRVVLERHLQEDRKRDHRAAQGDLLQHLLGDPDREVRESEQVRVEQRQLPLPLAAHQPVGQQRERDRTDRDQRSYRLAALLPHQDPQDDTTHAEDGQDRADHVDLPGPCVRHVTHELDLRQHDSDDDDLEQETDTPRQVGGDEPAEQRADCGRDRGRGPDQRVRLLPGRTLEVSVDERLHSGQQQRGAEAPDDGPEDDDRGQALCERHRQSADRVGEQTQHVGPLASDQIADLAADQDERGRDQRLERDRRLDAADRRVEIIDHRRDRDVHQRRVDDEHEHRHREQQSESWIRAGSLFRSADTRLRHLRSPFTAARRTGPLQQFLGTERTLSVTTKRWLTGTWPPRRGAIPLGRRSGRERPQLILTFVDHPVARLGNLVPGSGEVTEGL